MPQSVWGKVFPPVDADGNPMPLDSLPLVRALREQRPAFGTLRFLAADGREHEIHVTAIPIVTSHATHGALALFWPIEDEAPQMRVKVWGARGSIPSPGPETTRFGGNTSCVEVTLSDGTTIVLDAGTGARNLGLRMTGEGTQVNILLTHLHLDHIQGLMFFAPAFSPTPSS